MPITITTTRTDDTYLISDAQLGEPDVEEYGVGLYAGDWDKEWETVRRLLGLYKVKYDLDRDCYMYARYRLPSIYIIVVLWLARRYWWAIRWTYRNGRVFQSIPPSKPFSWRYLTAYTWAVNVKKQLENKLRPL